MGAKQGNGEVSVLTQFRALFMKNLSLQKRQTKTNICQILVPLVLISVIGVLQVVVDHFVSSGDIVALGGALPPAARDTYNTMPCKGINPDGNCFVGQNLFPAPGIAVINASDPVYWDTYIFQAPLYYFSAEDDATRAFLGSSNFDGTTSGLLGQMQPKQMFDLYSIAGSLREWVTPVSYNGYFPVFLESQGPDWLDNQIASNIEQYYRWAPTKQGKISRIYNATYSIDSQSYNEVQEVASRIVQGRFSEVRPFGGIEFGKLNMSAMSSRADAVGRIPFTIVANSFEFDQTGYETQRRSNILTFVSNSVLRTKLGKTGGTNLDPIIRTLIVNMPDVTQKQSVDVVSLAGGFCFSFAASFLLPVFVSNIVKDKQERQLMMMEMSGMKERVYWLITYVYNYLLYMCVLAMIFVTSHGFKMRLFTQSNNFLLFVLFFAWGHAEIMVAFFFSTFFSNAKTSTVVSYLLVIGGVITSNVVQTLEIFPSDTTPNFFYMIYPPFAFYRILYLMNDACGNFRCFGLSELEPGTQLTISFVYLLFGSLVFAILAAYLSLVFPRQYGVPLHPLFCILGPFRRLKAWCSRPSGYKSVATTNSLYEASNDTLVSVDDMGRGRSASAASIVHNEMYIDDDVVEETARIAENRFSEHCPVVIQSILKEYPPRKGGNGRPHVAVRNVSFAVEKGECFGLLGANGAGKTTLISVLTGLYEPTKGTARIDGYDLRTDMDKIHRRIGVCPQFDILSDDLTSREHLLFYARLKGVPRALETEKVEIALRQVNLLDAQHRLSKNLSGGMKRRLSLAIAIIGDPAIVILDEPTTGLDPKARHSVWEVLEAVKKDHSMILTTHGMDEADRLCTRIGIMSRGRLKCIGSQLHLKNKFGRGYQILFGCANESAIPSVREFVATVCPDAVLFEAFAGALAYSVPKELVHISSLFEKIEKDGPAAGVTDWGIKMTTLEDVFLNIIKRDEDEHGADDGGKRRNSLIV
eukprot:Opistho-2@44296